MSHVRKEVYVKDSTIETVDRSILNWLKELDLQTESRKGFRPVPVIWHSSERAYQVKHNKELRSENDNLILPIISLERTTITKDLTKKGSHWAALPPQLLDLYGGTFTVTKRIKQDKTAKYANANSLRRKGVVNFPIKEKNNEVVYEYVSIPIPVYVEIGYTVHIRTNYESQAVQLLQPFLTQTRGINMLRMRGYGGVLLELFFENDFSIKSNSDNIGEDERVFDVEVNFKTLAPLIGDGINQSKPRTVSRENAVEISFPRERTPNTHDDDFFDD